ncbi:O-antigen ligase family protein [Agromyces silvae]|uniref:O-antigen ligase family protein n=1 Tax=Agromyces silvae TaxID=3388266 RepID=UPI00280B3B14|nr:O-antigen ligase family protein [Agromyces protaetiae]
MTSNARLLDVAVVRDVHSRRTVWIGLLLGFAAAGSGLASPIAALGVRPWHMFVALAALIALTSIPPRDLLATRVRGVDIATAAFVVVLVIVELVNSVELSFNVDYVGMLSPLFYFAGYLAARGAVRTAMDALRFLRSFVLPIFVIAPLAIGQSLGVPAITNFVLTIAPGAGALRRLENDGLTRATGLVGHWTGFGGYLIIVVAAALAILIITARHTPKAGKATELRLEKSNFRPLAIWALLFAFVCLVTTLTFSVVLTAAVTVLLCARAAGFGRQVILLFGAVGVVGAVAFGALIEVRLNQQFAGRGGTALPGLPEWLPSTLNYRLRIWLEQTIPMISDRPITGWGNGTYEAVFGGREPGRVYPAQLSWHSPESQWFGTAMTYGVTGLVAQVILLTAVCVLLVRAARQASVRAAALPLLVTFVCAVATSITVPLFTNRGFPVAFWILVGVVAGLQAGAQSKSGVTTATPQSDRPRPMRPTMATVPRSLE